MNAQDLINELMKYYNVDTISELSEKIGIGQPAISKWRINNSVRTIKKRLHELGIYSEIMDKFEKITFNQIGKNNTQIKTHDYSPSHNIDPEMLKIIEALQSVAKALGKEKELKLELKRLINKISEA